MDRVRVSATVAVVLLLSSGCSLGAALGAAPPGTSTGAPSSAPVAASAAPTTPATPDDVVMASVPLGGAPGSNQLTVTRGRVQTGLVPPMHGWSLQCPVDFAALQYVPITLQADRDELAGHLTITPTATTPADIGTLGVFFDGAAEPYCQDDPPFRLTDTFWSHGNSGRTTAYVVLQDAVTPDTPQGRADVFATLDVRIDDLRVHSTGDVPYTLGPPAVGALCPDDADAICVPLP